MNLIYLIIILKINMKEIIILTIMTSLMLISNNLCEHFNNERVIKQILFFLIPSFFYINYK
jgi:hypothetical protein